MQDITLEKFRAVVKGVLFTKQKKRAQYENRAPTKAELRRKFKLENHNP